MFNNCFSKTDHSVYFRPDPTKTVILIKMILYIYICAHLIKEKSDTCENDDHNPYGEYFLSVRGLARCNSRGRWPPNGSKHNRWYLEFCSNIASKLRGIYAFGILLVWRLRLWNLVACMVKWYHRYHDQLVSVFRCSIVMIYTWSRESCGHISSSLADQTLQMCCCKSVIHHHVWAWVIFTSVVYMGLVNPCHTSSSTVDCSL